MKITLNVDGTLIVDGEYKTTIVVENDEQHIKLEGINPEKVTILNFAIIKRKREEVK